MKWVFEYFYKREFKIDVGKNGTLLAIASGILDTAPWSPYPGDVTNQNRETFLSYLCFALQINLQVI